MLAWLWSSVGLALPEEPTQRRLAVQQWTTDQGLLQNSITDLYQDAQGYLWMTTFGGLCRLDGLQFSCFDLASGGMPRNRLLSIAGDAAGTLWLGAQEGGLLRYRDDHFEAIHLSAAANGANVQDILVDRASVVWAATDQGLIRYEEGVGGRLLGIDDGLPSPVVLALAQDGDGALWIGTRAGLSRLQGDGVTTMWPGESVSMVLPDGQGGLWASTADALHHLQDGIAVRSIPLGHGPLQHAVLDPQGRLWVCGDAGESGWVDGAGYHPLPVDGPSRACRTGLVDRDGSLWIGTQASGLYQLRDRLLETFEDAAGLRTNAKIAFLEGRAGEVWIGSCSGLERWTADTGFSPAALGLDGCVRALALDADGRLLMGVDSRLFRLEGADARPERLLGTEGRVIYAILPAPDGSLLLGCHDGVLRWTPGAAAAEPLPGLEAVQVNVLRWDGDELLVGGAQGVLRWRPDGTLSRYSTETLPGFPNGVVRDLYVDGQGGVWIGSYGGGLGYLRDGTVTTLSAEEGLAENVVSRILADGQGRLWLNGNRGVSSVRLEALHAALRGDAPQVHATLFAGVEGNGGSGDAGVLTGEGALWFPNIYGLTRVTLAEVDAYLDASQPPQVEIEQVTLDGAPLLSGAAVAPGGRRDLAARYTAPMFFFPAEAQFQHRLVGYNDTWQVSSGRTASYTNLPPGSYRLEMRVLDNAGHWSDTAQHAFTLRPSLWERPTTRLAVLVGSISTLLLLIRRRIRRIRAQNRRLEEEILRRKTSEKAVQEREARYRAVFEGTEDGLIIYDSLGRVVALNPAARRLLQVEPQADLQAVNLPLLLDNGEERLALQQHLSGTLREGTPHSGEALLCHAAEAILARYAVVPFPLAEERGAMVSISDVTALRRAEATRLELQERIQRAQTIEAIGQLAGGVAHDFNNLLTVISTSAGLILEGDPPEALATDILDCSSRGAELVRRLLVVGQRQTYTPAPVPLRPLLASLERVFRSVLRDDIVLQVQLPDAELLALTDAAQLERALLNLVLNARDAMPRGGTLRVQGDVVTLTAEQLGGFADTRARAGSYTVITVEDSGTGIPPELLRRIFEPFFTTKPAGQGSGLGLSVVQSVVHRAGGFLDVESAPEQAGSCFRLFLPVAAAPPAAPPAAVPEGRSLYPDLSGVVILACDDQEDVLMSTVRMLVRWRASVLSASRPEEALRLAAVHRDAISMLLTDVVMPGMSGTELAQQVRQLRPGLPVLFISGYTRDTPAMDGPLLEKPFTPTGLGDAIRKLLRLP